MINFASNASDPDGGPIAHRWATTGHWPYQLQGQTRNLSVSIQGPANTLGQYAHGFSHQLGLKDLYTHANVSFPRNELASRWDNMDKPFNAVHPLTWSKELASWMTGAGAPIHFIPRPAKGTSRNWPTGDRPALPGRAAGG